MELTIIILGIIVVFGYYYFKEFKKKKDKLKDGTWELAKKIVSRRYTQEKLDE